MREAGTFNPQAPARAMKARSVGSTGIAGRRRQPGGVAPRKCACMLRFFIPTLEHEPQEGERRYDQLRHMTEASIGRRPSDRRVFSVAYSDGSRTYHAEVGRPDPHSRSLILCIFEIGDAYIVQTRASALGAAAATAVSRGAVIELNEFDHDAGQDTWTH
jgi:hypothetical protein